MSNFMWYLTYDMIGFAFSLYLYNRQKTRTEYCITAALLVLFTYTGIGDISQLTGVTPAFDFLFKDPIRPHVLRPLLIVGLGIAYLIHKLELDKLGIMVFALGGWMIYLL